MTPTRTCTRGALPLRKDNRSLPACVSRSTDRARADVNDPTAVTSLPQLPSATLFITHSASGQVAASSYVRRNLVLLHHPPHPADIIQQHHHAPQTGSRVPKIGSEPPNDNERSKQILAGHSSRVCVCFCHRGYVTAASNFRYSCGWPYWTSLSTDRSLTSPTNRVLVPVDSFRQAAEFLDDNLPATHDLHLLDLEQLTNTNTIVQPKSKPNLTVLAD